MTACGTAIILNLPDESTETHKLSDQYTLMQTLHSVDLAQEQDLLIYLINFISVSHRK